ncbi:hypothetical protein [Devosia sp.]|uniref:hypothetical protein n=1 Tax=Devosia sp. TaxID=1871048 RepID=UPI002FC94A09
MASEARSGNPILMDTPDGPDRIGGFHLVSWEEWFAALDEGGLALRVSDDPAGGSEAEFEFVERE